MIPFLFPFSRGLLFPLVALDKINHNFFLLLCSGYDFGYLLKLLINQNLPAEESDFFELLRIYFPSIYDVKVSYYIIWNIIF